MTNQTQEEEGWKEIETQELNYQARPFGNATKLFSWFIQAVRAKKKVVWKFPEGDVYSPEYLKLELRNAEARGREQGRKQVLDRVRVVQKSLLTHRDDIARSKTDIIKYVREEAAAQIGLKLLEDGLIKWDMQPWNGEYVQQKLELRVLKPRAEYEKICKEV